MFTSVKSLTAYIDKNIEYILDAKNHHECSEKEYQSYLIRMYDLLDEQISKLKSISCNHKLILRYENKVNEVKE